MYSLNRNVFETRILDILQEESDEIGLQQQRDAEYRQKVIDAFFEYGKLKSIPAQQKKKRIVLEVLVQAFEQDRLYSEREVNLLLSRLSRRLLHPAPGHGRKNQLLNREPKVIGAPKQTVGERKMVTG